MHKLGFRTAPWIVIFGTLVGGRGAISFPTDPDLPSNESDWLRPFLGYQYTYDDNLFRIPSASNFPGVGSLLIPGASPEDHINTYFAGLDGHWIVGRQSVDYDLEVDDNRFLRNDYLNNTSGTAKATWNWSFASVFSGTLGADYTRGLAGFADTFFYESDEVVRTEYFGSGRWQVGPRWAVYGSVSDADTTNTAAALHYNNFDTQSGKVGVEFATSLQNTLGVQYSFTHGHYPDPVATLNAVPYDPDYDENSAEFVAKLVFSDKTQLSGDAGYLRRNYPNATVGAFSGEIWHAKFLWEATDKTNLLVTAGRDLAAYLYAQSDYFIQDGISVTPTWKETDKLTWSALLSWYRQSYIGSSPSVLILGSRRDNISAEQVSVTYTPFRYLLLDLMYHHELRSSNQALLGYNDDIVQAGVKFRF
jgi:exopolysaccharide biosynthesis operon protein EpsL